MGATIVSLSIDDYDYRAPGLPCLIGFKMFSWSKVSAELSLPQTAIHDTTIYNKRARRIGVFAASFCYLAPARVVRSCGTHDCGGRMVLSQLVMAEHTHAWLNLVSEEEQPLVVELERLELDWDNMTIQYAQLDATYQSKKKSLEKMHMSAGRLLRLPSKTKLLQAEADLKSCRTRRNTVSQKLAETKQAHDNISEALASLEQKALQEIFDRNTRQLSASEAANAAARARYVATSATVARLKAQMVARDVHIDSLEQALDDLASDNARQAAANVLASKQAIASEKIIQTWKVSHQYLKMKLRQSTGYVAALKDRLDSLEQEGLTIDRQVDHLESEVNKITEQLASQARLHSELMRTQAENHKLKADLAEHQRAFDEFVMKVGTL